MTPLDRMKECLVDALPLSYGGDPGDGDIPAGFVRALVFTKPVWFSLDKLAAHVLADAREILRDEVLPLQKLFDAGRILDLEREVEALKRQVCNLTDERDELLEEIENRAEALRQRWAAFLPKDGDE